MKTSDQYLKIVEWSDEDGCYVGTCPGLMYGGVHGDDEIEVYKALVEAVNDAIALYHEDGKPLPPATIQLFKTGFNEQLKTCAEENSWV